MEKERTEKIIRIVDWVRFIIIALLLGFVFYNTISQ